MVKVPKSVSAWILSGLLLAGLGAAVADPLAHLPMAKADPAWTFSRARVSQDYREGNFEQVIEALRGVLVPDPRVAREDRIFALRLLGVVWVSDPATREKGRYCWLQLLALDPHCDLVDLFVGEEIDKVWERTRLEFSARAKAAPRLTGDSAWLSPEEAEALQRLLDGGEGRTASEPSPSPGSGEGGEVNSSVTEAKAAPFGNAVMADIRPYWKRPGSWIAAALAAGAIGFTVYYTLGDAPPAPDKLYHVSKETASAR